MMAHSLNSPVLSPQAFAALGGPDLVYVREVRAGEALADAPDALIEHQLAPDQILYAVHRADGERLAILGDRAEAFAACMAHELAPVSVH
jgi:hypothetical protein